MNPIDIAQLIVGFGLGGAMGAAAALLLAGQRVHTAFSIFARLFRAFLRDEDSERARTLRDAFTELEASLQAFLKSAEQLKRALKRR
jgi:gas vesicle protein